MAVQDWIGQNQRLTGWLDNCRQRPGRLALPEDEDERTQRAAAFLLDTGAVSGIVHFGDSQKAITNRLTSPAQAAGRLTLAGQGWPDLVDRVKTFREESLRSRGRPEDPVATTAFAGGRLNQAGWLLAQGEVDAVVAGCVESTADVLRALLATVGPAAGISSISSSMLLQSPDPSRPLWLFADCGVLIEPDAQPLTDIATAAAGQYRRLTGDPPVVAFLSFSTLGSASHPAAEKMARARALFHQRHPEVESVGEIQFDAAIDAVVGQRKCPGSRAPGRVEEDRGARRPRHQPGRQPPDLRPGYAQIAPSREPP